MFKQIYFKNVSEPININKTDEKLEKNITINVVIAEKKIKMIFM